MHHFTTMPGLISRAARLLPATVPPHLIPRLIHEARGRARARGLPETGRVVLKMLAEMRVDDRGRWHA